MNEFLFQDLDCVLQLARVFKGLGQGLRAVSGGLANSQRNKLGRQRFVVGTEAQQRSDFVLELAGIAGPRIAL